MAKTITILSRMDEIPDDYIDPVESIKPKVIIKQGKRKFKREPHVNPYDLKDEYIMNVF